jgi:PAS domain S-box-containing protein
LSFRDFEIARPRVNGAVHYVSVSGDPVFDASGEFLGYRGIGADITERKLNEEALRASEERHRTILQTAMDGFWLVDTQGCLLEANEAYCRMSGYSMQELMTMRIADLEAVETAGDTAAHIQKIMAAGEDRFQSRHHRKDGSVFDVEVSVTYQPFEGGRFVVFLQDTTERKRMETMNLQAQKMEALGTLAGGVAHDFNNIIAAIMGNVELARQDVGPVHDALESLEEIRKASRRAKDLVQQILAFGRKQATEREVISLAPVVQDAGRLLRSVLPAGVSLNVQCEPNVPAVLADTTQIEQILLNLCSNAWQAIPGDKQGAMIEVRLQSHEHAAGAKPEAGFEMIAGEMQPGRYACLTVRDNGSGMDKETLARMFEPFFTTKPVGKGTGLGLAVVHSIAQDHGASIQIRSTPGEGSIFCVCFPAAQVSEKIVRTVTPRLAPTHGQGQHILYIDDDEAIVLLMTRLLERQGYRVSGYTDAVSALAAVRTDPGQFDLAVTDYNMPGMSGLDVARAIKEIRADLPVAMASGYITDELRQQAPMAGVSELIYKPNSVEDLCEMVARQAHKGGEMSTSS